MTGIGRGSDAVGKWKIGANRLPAPLQRGPGQKLTAPTLKVNQYKPANSLPIPQVGTAVARLTEVRTLFGGVGMSILAWIVLGLIAGAIAKAIMPGNDPGGIIVTILIGIVGAFLGGFLGNMVAGSGLNGFSLWSIVLAVVGAILLLWIYRVAMRRRGTTTL